MFRKTAVAACSVALAFGATSAFADDTMSTQELDAHLATMVEPTRVLLDEIDYTLASGDSDEDPGCVMRIYGFMEKEVHTGTRMSLASQTRCEQKVEGIRHTTDLYESWWPYLDEGRAQVASDLPWEGWEKEVGPNGAFDTREAAGSWTDHRQDVQYLHQSNVQFICTSTDLPVDWDVTTIGRVSFDGQTWEAWAGGYESRSCWV